MVNNDINAIYIIPSISDWPEYDLTVKTEINVTTLVMRIWAASRYVWKLTKKYSASGLTIVEKVTASAQLLAVSCSVTIRDGY